MRIRKLLLPTLIVGAASAGAMAQPGVWIEHPSSIPGVDRNHTGNTTFSFGDAGEFVSDFDLTLGDTPLTTIKTSLVAFSRPQSAGGTLRSLDADLFCIHVTDPASFFATAAGTDTVLAMFRLDGTAVAFNDNRTDSLTSTGSRLTNNGVDTNGNAVTIPGLVAGDYLLGVSRADGGTAARTYGRPLDSSGNLIFLGPVNGGSELTDPNAAARRADLTPITPGTVLSRWELFGSSGFAPFNANVTITLGGAGFSAIPAPGASAVLGLAGLAALRRRR